MIEKMTRWNFSEHTHTKEVFVSDKGNTIQIDHLRKGDSHCGYVRFVNDDYGLTVYGDFGNWVFCRPFIPSEDGYVSVPYWNEKLKMKSTQDHSVYNGDETHEEICEMIADDEIDDKSKEILKDLLQYTDDEIEYTYQAFRNTKFTDYLDYDNIPFAKNGDYRLLIVYDAFNEICNRLNNQ